MNPLDALTALWSLGGLPPQALAGIALTGSDPVFPSSFAVGTAAQTSIAAAALAACELGHERGAPRQRVAVDMAHAAAECTGWFTLDGQEPELWDPFAGLYRCADGYVRVHTNFPHHRDGALRLLGLDPQLPHAPTQSRPCGVGRRWTSSRPRPTTRWWPRRCAASPSGMPRPRVRRWPRNP